MFNKDIFDKDKNIVATIIDFKSAIDNSFISKASDEFQIGYQFHPNGKIIEKHIHNSIDRIIKNTSEFIFVLSGEIIVTVFDNNGRQIKRLSLNDNQAILQHKGGHSFQIKPGTKFFEIKQGPYFGNIVDKKYENTS